MNCDNCPNEKESKCCHETIRNQTEVTGNARSIKRDIEHIERMQKARKHQPLHGVLVDLPKEI